VPEENCEFRPQRICHSVRKKRNRRVRRNHWQQEQQQQRQKRSHGRRNRLFKYFDEQPQQQRSSQLQRRERAGNSNCINEPFQKCEKMKMNPRTVKKQMRKKVCRSPQTEDDQEP
jgi:hypothetical protein